MLHMPLMVTNLPALLAANPSVDWRAIRLGSDQARSGIDCNGMAHDAAVPLLMAYQRLVCILPPTEDHRAIPLLESGLHSAIQIASLPQHQFERHWASLFPGEEALGLRVYRAALSRRSALLHRHMNELQRNEPHYRAARFK